MCVQCFTGKVHVLQRQAAGLAPLHATTPAQVVKLSKDVCATPKRIHDVSKCMLLHVTANVRSKPHGAAWISRTVGWRIADDAGINLPEASFPVCQLTPSSIYISHLHWNSMVIAGPALGRGRLQGDSSVDLLSTLPLLCSEQVLMHMDGPTDLCNAAKVCKQWQVLASSERVWSYHYCKNYPRSHLSHWVKGPQDSDEWLCEYTPCQAWCCHTAGCSNSKNKHNSGGSCSAAASEHPFPSIPKLPMCRQSSSKVISLYTGSDDDTEADSEQDEHELLTDGDDGGDDDMSADQVVEDNCTNKSPPGFDSWRCAYSWKLGVDCQWRSREPHKVATGHAHLSWVNAVKLVPNSHGGRVVSGGADGGLFVWDAEGHVLQSCDTPAAVWSVDADNHLFVCGDMSGRVAAWDMEQGSLLSVITPGNGNGVGDGAPQDEDDDDDDDDDDVACTAQLIWHGNGLLTAHHTQSPKLWDLRVAQRRSVTHEFEVNAAEGATTRIPPRLLSRLPQPGKSPHSGVIGASMSCARMDGNIVMLGALGGGLYTYDVRASRRPLSSVIAYELNHEIFSMSCSWGRLATSTLNGIIKLWDIAALTHCSGSCDFGIMDPRHTFSQTGHTDATSAYANSSSAAGSSRDHASRQDTSQRHKAATQSEWPEAMQSIQWPADGEGETLASRAAMESGALLGMARPGTSVYCVSLSDEWQLGSVGHAGSACVWDISGVRAARSTLCLLPIAVAWYPSLDIPLGSDADVPSEAMQHNMAATAADGGIQGGALQGQQGQQGSHGQQGQQGNQGKRPRLRASSQHGIDLRSESSGVHVVVAGRDALVRMYSMDVQSWARSTHASSDDDECC